MNIRLRATKYIWTAYTLTMIVLFMGTAVNEFPIGVGHVVVAIIASAMAFLTTGTVWNWGNVQMSDAEEEEEMSDRKKRKNQAKLEAILSRLSDDERAALRDQLDEDTVHYGLSDDGEIVTYR